MEKLFTFLSNQYVLSVVTILCFILTIIAIHITRKYRKVKILALNEWINIELLDFPQKIKKDLTIKYKNKIIDSFYELNVKLKNYGTVVLTKKDFDSLPYITFNSNVQILDVRVDAKEGYINPSYTVTEENIVICFNFIEPKDIIEVKVLYTSNGASGGKIAGKIIGGNKIQGSFESEIQLEIYKESKAIGKLLYMIISGLLFFSFIAIMLKLNISNDNFIIVFSGILSIIIGLLFGGKIRESIYNKKLNKYISQGKINK